jgi:ribose/xylose/arabinose/galactoside ABC-type transport system permease subunit
MEGRADPFALFARFAPLVFLLLLMAVFSVLEPRFLTARNLLNVLRQVSIYGIIGVGMTFVILTGGIDLSVGSLLALAGMLSAVVSKGGLVNSFAAAPAALTPFSWWVAALTAPGVGAAGGALQGLLVSRLRVPAFVVTLGGMSAFRGLTLIVGNGGPISGFGERFAFWGQGQIGPFPVPALAFLAVAVGGHVVLRHSAYGRAIYALGGNREAARLCGLPVRWLDASVYLVVGLCAGLGGFLLTSRLDSAEAVAGSQYELSVIAAVVIGGTSLFGGVGTVFGTVVGTVLVGVLLNGLVILNVSSYVQQIIIGGVIVFAVAFDTYAKSRSRA